jgi:large subunit ribosomal protein L25
MREIKVLCEPSKIPEFIEADVTNLQVGESIHISDLKFGEGIEVHELPETVIASVVIVKEEELEPQLEEGTEPEIVGEEGEGEEEDSAGKDDKG